MKPRKLFMRKYIQSIVMLIASLDLACGPDDDGLHGAPTRSTAQALNESTEEAGGASAERAIDDGVATERTPLHDAIDSWGIDTVPSVRVDAPPESAVAAQERQRERSTECSTGEDGETHDEDNAIGDRDADRESTDYEPSIAGEGRLGAPAGIRGGDRLEWPANPDMVGLIDEYRASGCADDARVDDPACRDHPYRQALDQERAAFRTIVTEARSEP
jgi:hypothetical protein